MTQPIFRFAPSPNGRLHLGHAYSALLNQKMARDAGGRLLLRMEDTDQTRCKPEFINGIYEDLTWLGIAWETPVRIQSEHFADYETSLARLWAIEAIYPCFCSRKSAATLSSCDPEGQPHYAGTCRNLPRSKSEARIARGDSHGWRMNMSKVEGPAAIWGDCIIAKRHVGSSYHIAVVTDDHLQGVTHIVRGKDMESATPLHRLLQSQLGFTTPAYHHHDLIKDENGGKLSKRNGSTAIASLRQNGATAQHIREQLGFAPAPHP